MRGSEEQFATIQRCGSPKALAVQAKVSAQGPMLGQSMYFNRIAATKGEKDDFAIARFGKEAERCLKMLDDQLQQSGGPYLLGKNVSSVDVSCFPYAASAYWACIDISDMPQLQEVLPRMFDQLSASCPTSKKGTNHLNLHSLDPRFSLGVRLHASTVQTVGILNVLNGQMVLLGLGFGSVHIDRHG